jgi:hypothetical protein
MRWCIAWAPTRAFIAPTSTVRQQSLQERHRKVPDAEVINFWKWETRWGKFSTDFDPVKKENIMVTGFLLQGIALHVAITGDQHYAHPRSLKFQITDKQVYEYDIHSLAEALVKQWAETDYCLIACEPN